MVEKVVEKLGRILFDMIIDVGDTWYIFVISWTSTYFILCYTYLFFIILLYLYFYVPLYTLLTATFIHACNFIIPFY